MEQKKRRVKKTSDVARWRWLNVQSEKAEMTTQEKKQAKNREGKRDEGLQHE